MSVKTFSRLNTAILCALFIFSGCSNNKNTFDEEINEPDMVKTTMYTPVDYCPADLTQSSQESEIPDHESDIRLIALVTMAEAESECEEGKRLVIDTILNRADSEHFPDTIYDVIYQPYQFSSMWNGRVERCEVREDICELVREEMSDRSNYDCVFFNAGDYSDYGVPMFQIENHYFSSYEIIEGNDIYE